LLIVIRIIDTFNDILDLLASPNKINRDIILLIAKLRHIFFACCGDFPGAVVIRHSYLAYIGMIQSDTRYFSDEKNDINAQFDLPTPEALWKSTPLTPNFAIKSELEPVKQARSLYPPDSNLAHLERSSGNLVSLSSYILTPSDTSFISTLL
jgi:hypothetical protein